MLAVWLVALCQPAWATMPFANPGPVVQVFRSVTGEMSHLLQGRSGYIWIGTSHGLVRFDGQQTKLFSHDPDNTNSLSHNYITYLVEDAQGILWIATYGGGLNRFDPSSFEFTHYRHNPDDPTSISSDQLFTIAKGKNNTLWLGGYPGMTLFDINTGKSVRKDGQMKAMPAERSQRFRVLFEDSKQQLWYSYSGNGLFRFNPKNNQISHFSHDDSDPNSLAANKINKVYESHNGEIWIATSKGMNRFNPDTNRFTRFELPLKAQNHIKALNIVAIYEDNQQRLWVGTLYNGLSLFDRERQRFIEINDNAKADDALNSLSVTAILQDQSGALWLTTLGEGLIKVSSMAMRFKGLSGKNQSRLTIGALAKGSDGSLWVGANNNLYRLDEQNLVTELHAKSQGHINNIIKAPDGSLLLSIFGQGIFRYDPHGQDKPILQPLPVLPNNNLHTMALDKNGTLWLGLFRSGKQKTTGLLSLTKGEKHYNLHIKDDVPSSILPLDDGRLLIGFRYQGLKVYHPQSQQLTSVTHLGKNISSVWHLFEDSKKRIWFATQDFGLGRFYPQQNQVSFITEREGLPGNTVYPMTEDEFGQLWFGSKAGLVRFNPDNSKIDVYDRLDGMPKLQFIYSKLVTTSGGRIMLADNQRLTLFAPSDFTVDVPQANQFKTLLTGLTVLNQTITPGKSIGENPLRVSIDKTKHLYLSYQDYMFSLSFASTNYDQGNKLKYAYKMEGLDSQWIEKPSNDRRATFTSLPAKTYEFKVKTSNADGSWGEDYRSLKITISPPWWQTQWAYMGYFLAIFISLYCLYRFKTTQLVKRAEALERGVKERTKTIDGLLAQKEHLFANISHEFRTPLTLILSPIEQLLSRPELRGIGNELALVERSANRLLLMVDQLLEFSKLDNASAISAERVSLEQALDLVKTSFDPLFKSKNQRLTIYPFTDVALLLIPDSLNKILINIVANAHKYTPQNGQISIVVTANETSVEIAISDSGIGIAKEYHQEVFERFCRVADTAVDFNPGAGIGLALVKELCIANQGDIRLTSQLGQGATFTVILPIAPLSSLPVKSATETMMATIDKQLHFSVGQPHSAEQLVDTLPLQQQAGTKSILIIDDNADMRQMLCGQLNSQYVCLVAENGQAGMKLAKEQIPDLIIADVMMPLMDGYQLAEKLKADEMTSHIPIIMLTAKGGLQSRLRGLSLLVDDYLAKPFNLGELVLRIQRLLAIRDIISKRAGQQVASSSGQPTKIDFPVNELEQQFLDKLQEQLAKHYDDPELTMAVLSRALNISEKQLQRKLKACYDQTFPEWLRNYRLHQAATKLEQGHKASQVYYAVGFSSHAYFSKCFKSHFGCSPSQYFQIKAEKAMAQLNE